MTTQQQPIKLATVDRYQVPHFELTCAPKHALPQHVFRGARGPKCHDLRLYKQELNVAGQGQPKH